ncbi:DUF4012 domain-containing protein [uncultured Parolsenella sp.]|uniref:DUF4012 domain-containing protein n=1 Tax=uncultured Parolsenella sp. TaxID=2083008 RepID=UPI0027D97A02|nr:DUF4012 domain-containing protein [uncultured Parolsenella sp.]
MASHMAGGDGSTGGRRHARSDNGRAGRAAAPSSRYDERPSAASRLDEVERVKRSHKGPKPGKRVHRHRGLKRFLIAFFAILVVLGGVGGFCGYRMYRDVKSVQADAQKVLGVSDALKQAVKDGDGTKVASAMNDAAAAASRMKVTTHTTLWNVASHIPVYGEDVKTVQSLTTTVDTLASEGLVPLGKGLSQVNFEDLIGDDGSIDVATMQTAVDALQTSAPSIHQANQELQALPKAHIGKLNDVLTKAQDKFSSVDAGVTAAEAVAPYVPQLFGANGQTATYLVTAQNTSEIRATGGYPGSMGLITVTDGKMSVGDFSSIYSVMGGFDTSALGVTQEEVDAYDWGSLSSAGSVGDASFSPDFTRAADVWKRAYEAGHPGTTITGVIGVSPVFLQNMMKLTGQTVEAGGMSLNGDNVGKALMHDTYWKLPVDQQDAFFAGVASQVFSGMMGSLGKVNMTDLLQFVKDNGSAGNFHVWFADDALNSAFSSMNVSGSIPDTDEAKPQVGVYYNDRSYSKMGWYISINNQVGQGVKNADGTTTYQVTTTIKNNLGGGELSNIPQYVSGYSTKKRGVGDAVFILSITNPAGGTVSDVSASSDKGGGLSFSQHAVDGHTLQRAMGNLNAGETMTVTYTVTVSANATEPLTVHQNPTAQAIAGWQ